MRRASVLLLAVAALSGCAAQPAQESAAPATSATPFASKAAPSPSKAVPSPGGSVISLPPGLPKTTAVGPPTDDFTVFTTSGQVRVRGTCVELVTDQHIWVLVGEATKGLADGGRVTVTGLPDPSFETQCMGSPLKVSKVETR